MVALTAGVGSVAHDVHDAVLVLGLLGLAALLVPWPAATGGDDHDRRVAALRAQLAGREGQPAAPLHRTASPAVPAPVARLWLPLAVVSTVVAAGVHAAVGPAHWREGVVLGLFFVVTSLAQVAGAAALALRPSSLMLRTGVVGTTALVAVWVLSRTLGVPLVQAGPEPVGPWDLACVAWEVLAVGAGLVALRSAKTRPMPRQLPPWRAWHPAVRLMTAASVTMLLVLSTSGVGS